MSDLGVCVLLSQGVSWGARKVLETVGRENESLREEPQFCSRAPRPQLPPTHCVVHGEFSRGKGWGPFFKTDLRETSCVVLLIDAFMG